MRAEPLSSLVGKKKVIVCCGSGGVGKTTTSAALAIRAALDGRRAVVVTIDPAKRLATSLGLKGLSPHASDITPVIDAVLRETGRPPLSGSVAAVMPDTAQTFERFVKTMAGPDEGLAKRVLRTSIYKIFAREFAGTNEYMAMEKLHEIYHEGGYDVVILDTPPATNTRAFLEAPRMLADFFDDRIIHWIIRPGSRLVASGVKKAMEVLERLTGHGFISELFEFVTALFELRAQVMKNLKEVGDLLHGEDVSFLMVTSAERLSKTDTHEFVRILEERGYPFWGFVVNRMLGPRVGVAVNGGGAGGLDPDALLVTSRETMRLSPADEKALVENFRRILPLLEYERDVAEFLRRLPTEHVHGVAIVPEQPGDVHSVSALLAVSEDLGKI